MSKGLKLLTQVAVNRQYLPTIGIRQGNKRVEWQNDCGLVLMPKDNIRTRVVIFDTAKHFIIPTEAVLV